MNPRKLTVLRVELELFLKRIRSQKDLERMWEKDPEAIEFFRSEFKKLKRQG